MQAGIRASQQRSKDAFHLFRCFHLQDRSPFARSNQCGYIFVRAGVSAIWWKFSTLTFLLNPTDESLIALTVENLCLPPTHSCERLRTWARKKQGAQRPQHRHETTHHSPYPCRQQPQALSHVPEQNKSCSLDGHIRLYPYMYLLQSVILD